MPANPPSRATANLTLSLNGLFTVPCAVFSGSEESSVQRSQFVKGTDHRVGKKDYNKVTGADVTADQIEKRVETADGTWVAVTDDEISLAVGGIESNTVEVIGFLPLDRLTDGTYSTEGLNQIRPAKDRKGTRSVENPAANKAFTLLTEVMRRKGVFALVNYTSRSRPRFAAVTPDGQFLTLRFDEEVRAPRPVPLAEVSEQELSLGEMLVSAKIMDEPPVLVDTANNAVRSFAEEKRKAMAEGREIAAPQATVQAEAPNDLLAALTAAVQAG